MIPRKPVAIANEIRMKRSQFAGSFLIVEGSDDRRFMEPFTCKNTCNITVAQGKENVREVITILEEAHFEGIIGLIDADFDRIENRRETSHNIVKPDRHDLETMLLHSLALDKLLVEYGSPEKLQSFGSTESVLNTLLEMASPLANLRLHSRRNNLSIRFDGLNYSSWIERRSLAVDLVGMINAVKNNSQRHSLDSQTLLQAVWELNEEGLDPGEVCNGTDLIEILSIALRGRLGTNSAMDVNGENLRRILRAGLSKEEFNTSNLASEIREWQIRSAGFKILKD